MHIFLVHLSLSIIHSHINAEELLESSCREDKEINEKWIFIGKNSKYDKNYSINPLGVTKGVIVNCMNGYELSGFDEEGKAEKIFLSFYSSILVQGWFQKLESKVETTPLVFEMTRSGDILINGLASRFSENTAWTLGRTKTSVSIDKKSVGLLKEQIILNFENCYLNKSEELEEKDKVFIDLLKNKTKK